MILNDGSGTVNADREGLLKQLEVDPDQRVVGVRGVYRAINRPKVCANLRHAPPHIITKVTLRGPKVTVQIPSLHVIRMKPQ
jgi:hypothetical protein